jgi:GntR family transcriptional regulator
MAPDSSPRTLVDCETEVPLYRCIEEDLLAQITEGRLNPGDLIPAERELCEHYGVSRITVRRAISELQIRGSVRRQQGKGTFVSHARIERAIGRMQSFSEEMRAQGHKPGSKLLNLQHCPADHSTAMLLHLDEGAPVWIVERLRLADDEVVAFSISWLNLPPDAYLAPMELRTESSLWSLLAGKGVYVGGGHTTVRATIADARYAGLLGIAEGEPLLVRTGVNHGTGTPMVPVEAYEIVSRADRYQYSLPLVRQPTD